MADQGRSKPSKNDRPPMPSSPENGLPPSSQGLMARTGAPGLALGVLAVIIVGLFYLFGGAEEQVVEDAAEEGESRRSATLTGPVDGSDDVSVGAEGQQDAVLDAFEGSNDSRGEE